MAPTNEIIPVSDRLLRKAMFIAFGGKCFYTGQDISFEEMHIDHIKPKKIGGLDCISNYVLCCQRINLAKNGRHSDRFEDVVKEVVGLLYASKVSEVLADLRLNESCGFVRINTWLRSNGIDARSKIAMQIRNALRDQSFRRIRRKKEGATKGMVLYNPDDLTMLAKRFSS